MFSFGNCPPSTDTRLFPPTTFKEQSEMEQIPTIYMNEWDLREYTRLLCMDTKNMSYEQLKGFHDLARDKYQVDESNRINEIKNKLDSMES